MDELEQMIARAKATVKREPSRAEAFGRGGLQGATFGFGDEISGAASGLMQAAANTRVGKALLEKALGIDLVEADAGAAYRDTRDVERAANKAAEEAHGGYYLGGNVAGGLLTGRAIPGLKVGKDATLLRKSLLGAANALPAGALYGAGASEADALGGVLQDAGQGALVAAPFGAGAPVVGAGLRALPGAMRNAGLAIGRRVLTGGRKNVRLDPEAVEQAMENRTVEWFGTKQGAAKRAEALADELDDAYRGTAKKAEAAGVQGAEGSEYADAFTKRATELAADTWDTGGTNVPDMFRKAAEEAAAKAGETGRYTLGRSMNVIRNLQKKAKWNPAADSAANEANKAIAGIAREVTEDSIERQVARSTDPVLKELGAQLTPAKRALHLALQAADASERAALSNPHPLSLRNLGLGALAGGGHALGHAALSLGSLGTAIPVALASHLAHTRGPSTAAQFLYQGSKLPGVLGRTRLVQALRDPASRLAAKLGPQGASGALGDELADLLPLPTPPPALAQAEREELEEMIANARREAGSRKLARRSH